MWILCNIWVEFPADCIHEFTPPCSLTILNEEDVFGITYKTVVACIIKTGERGKVSREVRTFATTTAGLLALSDWLGEHDVSQVAMESTGVYWRPVFNILEATYEVI